ncbi:MAG: guanylate kinase [Chloroflexi bacterium]|nr:MAG: guanylate kinase [Chloroflexota bacterium]TME90692.1 MAG: guanylate kinase [Chloroflexota bacterium]
MDDDHQTLETPASGLVFVLSGPSGVGKSSLIERLKRDDFPITHCVTATTRPRRQGEEHGVHYYFLADAEYDALLEKGQFLEHAVVHNLYRYGIPLHSIRDALRRGQDVILAPDVQGASTVRWKLPNAISIFLRPPSLDELAPRLAARGTETTEERHIRLATAEREMQRVSEYDYVIVNHRDRLDQAVGDLKAIIVAERLRVCPRTVTL